MIRGCAIILGTLFVLLPDFWVPFWAISGFLGIIVLVKFDFFKDNPDFGVLILMFYILYDILECCLQCSCFLFLLVRFNLFLWKRVAKIK